MGAYAEAGVDIDKADRIVERIKPLISRGNTGFAAVHEFPRGKLVTSTDGVGTKIKLANTVDFHAAPPILGKDLVGMVFNDIITTGARPLHFLDYIAMNQLHEDYVVWMVEAIHKACLECGAELVGGETAELPNHFSDKRIVEMVGFGTGHLQYPAIDGKRIDEGDVLLGILSSGPHSNGYSLINKLVNTAELPIWGTRHESTQYELLEPTRLYFPILSRMVAQLARHQGVIAHDPLAVIRGAAHITGGGLIENIPRMFATDDLTAVLDYDVLGEMRLPIFDKIMDAGKVSEDEMFRTFNMGVGFVLCVNEIWADRVWQAFKETGEIVYRLGTVLRREPSWSKVMME